jgi:hypothetical protein
MPAFRSSVRHWQRLFGRLVGLALTAVLGLMLAAGKDVRAQQAIREGVPVVVS